MIADTVKAGYNALLMRDLTDNSPAPSGSELGNEFATPQAASSWVSNVVGDQTITTCNDASCKSPQGGISGRGLLPWITTCDEQNPTDCTEHLRSQLANLVSGQSPLTKDTLTAVSTPGLMISPQVIMAIRAMDSTQQSLLVGKLAQEVATQRVVERALLARTLLHTGSQVPVIAANQPAQRILQQAIAQLDKELQALTFSAQIRKQLFSDTVSQILNYQTAQQAAAMTLTPVTPPSPLLENSALPKTGGH